MLGPVTIKVNSDDLLDRGTAPESLKNSIHLVFVEAVVAQTDFPQLLATFDQIAQQVKVKQPFFPVTREPGSAVVHFHADKVPED